MVRKGNAGTGGWGGMRIVCSADLGDTKAAVSHDHRVQKLNDAVYREFTQQKEPKPVFLQYRLHLSMVLRAWIKRSHASRPGRRRMVCAGLKFGSRSCSVEQPYTWSPMIPAPGRTPRMVGPT